MTTREKMIRHIHSINKYLTVKYLKEETDEILLANCHPTDRADYTRDLKWEKAKQESEKY